MKLEDVSCGVCGSNEAEFLFEADNFRLRVTNQRFGLRRCRSCGLVYTSPRPAVDEMGAFYQDAYYAGDRSAGTARLNEYFGEERVAYARRFKATGRVLDVGCGAGVFLEQMLRAGYDAYGVEPFGSLGEDNGLRDRIYRGGLGSCSFPAGSFDLVTLWHVLEHVPDPMDTLRQVRRLLKPDGVLLLEVPNFGCLEARWLGPHWFALDVPRHYWHFTPETLRNAGTRAGFAPVTVQASAWDRPSFALRFLLSGASGFPRWFHARQGTRAGTGVLDSALTAVGVLGCLACRAWPLSLPTMRLVGRCPSLPRASKKAI